MNDYKIDYGNLTNYGALTLFVDALTNGQKLLAIKHYRGITGEGLREAKDAVEGLIDAVRPMVTPKHPYQPPVSKPERYILAAKGSYGTADVFEYDDLSAAKDYAQTLLETDSYMRVSISRIVAESKPVLQDL